MFRSAKILLAMITAAVIAAVTAPSSFAMSSPPVSNQYVALGDSYSSGVGADADKNPYGFNYGNINPETYEPASLETGCLRNDNAYPHLVAQATGYDLTFVACGGATIDTVIEGYKGEPSQLDALSESTELVTLTIGGNDAGFFNIVLCILTTPECDSNNPVIAHAHSFIQNELPTKYDSLFAQIRARAPYARIMLLGYGMVMPNGPEQDPWASPTERRVATDVFNRLNSEVRAAASRNGATFVDMFAPGSAYNTPEASMGNVTAGSLTWSLRLESPVGVGSSVHPTRAGQREMARLTVNQLL